ncbi:DNA-binding transcriptional regulator FrlR [Mycobacterium avium subsp. paratuberculosis]|nr:DNA-binding transcriptional regulator FrlR [Mycobacterium avium subsp. paratuberculosis]
MPQTISGDHRYLQIARALRKEIVDGVYPVGSQLPTEHQLCAPAMTSQSSCAS